MVNRKHLSQNVAFGLFRLLSLSVVGILFAILGFIIYKMWKIISAYTPHKALEGENKTMYVKFI